MGLSDQFCSSWVSGSSLWVFSLCFKPRAVCRGGHPVEVGAWPRGQTDSTPCRQLESISRDGIVSQTGKCLHWMKTCPQGGGGSPSQVSSRGGKERGRRGA